MLRRKIGKLEELYRTLILSKPFPTFNSKFLNKKYMECLIFQLKCET